LQKLFRDRAERIGRCVPAFAFGVLLCLRWVAPLSKQAFCLLPLLSGKRQ
jgi:hypothetical protein